MWSALPLSLLALLSVSVDMHLDDATRAASLRHQLRERVEAAGYQWTAEAASALRLRIGQRADGGIEVSLSHSPSADGEGATRRYVVPAGPPHVVQLEVLQRAIWLLRTAASANDAPAPADVPSPPATPPASRADQLVAPPGSPDPGELAITPRNDAAPAETTRRKARSPSAATGAPAPAPRQKRKTHEPRLASHIALRVEGGLTTRPDTVPLLRGELQWSAAHRLRLGVALGVSWRDASRAEQPLRLREWTPALGLTHAAWHQGPWQLRWGGFVGAQIHAYDGQMSGRAADLLFELPLRLERALSRRLAAFVAASASFLHRKRRHRWDERVADQSGFWRLGVTLGLRLGNFP